MLLHTLELESLKETGKRWIAEIIFSSIKRVLREDLLSKKFCAQKVEAGLKVMLLLFDILLQPFIRSIKFQMLLRGVISYGTYYLSNRLIIEHKEKIIEIADEICRLSKIENHGLDAYILWHTVQMTYHKLRDRLLKASFKLITLFIGIYEYLLCYQAQNMLSLNHSLNH
jgi:hypothetical protein